MKIKYTLALLFMSGLALTTQGGMMVDDEGMMMQEGQASQCYCSDLCGPRDVTPNDTPFFDGGVDGYKQCFCAPRDKVNYERKGCAKKESELRSVFRSVCDKESEAENE